MHVYLQTTLGGVQASPEPQLVKEWYMQVNL